jgi:hypothetical protein
LGTLKHGLEEFMGEGYYRIRLWFTPKPAETPTGALTVLTTSSSM